MTPHRKGSVVTTNEDIILVTRAGSITHNSSLSLYNTLLITGLLNHLLLVSEVTEQLDSIVLMFFFFFALRYPNTDDNSAWD